MAPELVQVPSNQLDGLAAQAQRLGAAGLVRGIELLGAALTEMRHAPDPRVLLDVATVQLTADNASGDTAALVQRIERLERQVAAGVAPSTVAAAPAPRDPSTGRAALGGRARPVVTDQPAAESERSAPAAASAPAQPPAVQPATVQPAASPAPSASRTEITADAWDNTIRPALRGMARAVYGPTVFVRSTDSSLTLSVPNAVHRAKCEEQRAAVEAALAAFAGGPITVELIDGGDGGGAGVRGAAEPSAPASSPASSPGPVDAGAGASADAASSPRARGLAAAAATAAGDSIDDESPAGFVDLPDDDEVDLDDLIDAPPETVKSPIDRLAEAFPGSELIEEAG
jgi:DNA polymerase-3 subunit gamma/tau